MAASSVGLVIVAYGCGPGELIHGLDQWSAQDRPPDATYVVANAPLAVPDELAQRIHILRPGTNLGFGGGVNLAADAAAADAHTHLLISNLDIEILSTTVLAKLLDGLNKTPEAAFASPGIVMGPDRGLIWYRGGRVLRPAWISRHPGIGRRWARPSLGLVRTGFFSGCCALIDLPRFRAMGGFDETLFMYYEEVEVAERAATRGWYSLLVDEPLVFHAKPGRGFNPNEAYWHARNCALLLDRHERGVRHSVGRIIQWAATPLQMRRCATSTIRAAYLAGLRRQPPPAGIVGPLKAG